LGCCIVSWNLWNCGSNKHKQQDILGKENSNNNKSVMIICRNSLEKELRENNVLICFI
jgi:hypothetical protein